MVNYLSITGASGEEQNAWSVAALCLEICLSLVRTSHDRRLTKIQRTPSVQSAVHVKQHPNLISGREL